MSNSILNLAISLSILLFCTNCTIEDEAPIDNAADFETFLQEEMEDQYIPALSVLIFEKDNILQESHLGKSNIEQNIALENDHLFLLASISKMVTGTALLQLKDDGLLELDDKINDYLPFNVAIPDETEDITFRMLLTHTSGIADGSALDDQYYYGVDSPIALGDFLEDYLVPGRQYYDASENFHNFAPGTKSEYSNVGSALIGVLVEEISGMGFVDYCNQNIFTPLGMTNTAWRLDEITQTIVQPYDYVSNENVSIEHYTFTDYPNGGLRSTARDMHKFLTTFTNGGLSNGVQVLSTETVTEMLSLQFPDVIEETGLHIFVMDTANNLWGHDGGEQGVATIMAFNPTTKVGAIVFSNQGEADLDDILVESYKLGLGL